MRRRGIPEELANAIVFISSAEASYISGTVFEVDGGLSAT
jgi:NAD(P)-dependent dehydrogenase (short-subunit alcohol dehydrogenase family)